MQIDISPFFIFFFIFHFSDCIKPLFTGGFLFYIKNNYEKVFLFNYLFVKLHINKI